MATVSAPQDKEIAELNAKIGATLVPVALKGEKWDKVNEEVLAKQKASETAPVAVAAERRAYLSSGYQQHVPRKLAALVTMAAARFSAMSN